MVTSLRVPAPRGSRNRSAVQRHLDVAAGYWVAGRPHAALTYLDQQGLGVMRRTFQEVAVAWARSQLAAVAAGDPAAVRAARRRVGARAAGAPRRYR